MGGNQTSAEYEGYDSDTLELEGDSCINTAIKEHALIGKDGNFRKKKGDYHNLQLKDAKRANYSIGEGSKFGENESQVSHDSQKNPELTRQVDLVKGCQIREPLKNSEIILGSSKDPGYHGILAEWSPKTQTVYQIKTDTLCLSGGNSQWNRSLALSYQQANDPTVNKGKKILECSEGDVKDKLEDLMSGYLQDMEISNCRKRKLDDTEGFEFSAAKKTGIDEPDF
ncbi:hypothetical protein V6N11_011101 [Hibiscus sabdariffa]|uniref:Uncharacterized protein n=1 Tax=Hibiscus sabdariffa TaxID=183260 RepID=A0ABR2S7Y3_9ROSI